MAFYQNYNPKTKKLALSLGVTFNIVLLGYFKYTDFIIMNFNFLTNSHFDLKNIALPLAISFFTFQQISYLVDCSKGIINRKSFLEYALCVAFFPHLIAGPIVNYRDLLSQFSGTYLERINWSHFAKAISIFTFGLFKKVIIADTFSIIANNYFKSLDSNINLNFIDSWFCISSYSFQIYFDFSGYSDMAIGLAMFFGIYLPINFNSPYKSFNIVDFWRKWHISLSDFLKNYLYIPMGGNRSGNFRRYLNLMLTMCIGGVWHGATWNFFIWGFLHGSYLMCNHFWKTHVLAKLPSVFKSNRGYNISSWFLTYVCVLVAWVFFRAKGFDQALMLLKGMFGFFSLNDNPFSIPTNGAFFYPFEILSSKIVMLRSHNVKVIILYSVIALITFLLPNTSQIFSHEKATILNKQMKFLSWSSSFCWMIILSIMLIWSIFYIGEISEFIYYDF